VWTGLKFGFAPAGLRELEVPPVPAQPVESVFPDTKVIAYLSAL
jgi:hypothetical protein